MSDQAMSTALDRIRELAEDLLERELPDDVREILEEIEATARYKIGLLGQLT